MKKNIKLHQNKKPYFMFIKPAMFLLLLCSFSCKENAATKKIETEKILIPISQNENLYQQIKNIPLPDGYTHVKNAENSFAQWLENVGLKKDETVYKFDGFPKYNQTAQYAVLDITVGKKDLQQCADAVMRLRAEYLFSQQAFDKIVFIDNENVVYKFTAPYTLQNFTKYLDRVFGMCGSASLAKQLKPKPIFESIQAGDVIIRGGFPGHAVIVMDVALNIDGEKIYMLAQSYMPAQDIHVLNNPTDENLSPWYKVNNDATIFTPEYTFKQTELKEW